MRFFLLFFIIPITLIAQKPSIGLYVGTSIGYNSIYPPLNDNMGLLDISLKSDESILTSILLINDNDLTNNNELINGGLLGIRATLPIISGIFVQPELQFQKLDFNHIVFQNGTGVFNNPVFGLAGLSNNDKYIIANYFWRVNYLNFPFLIKIKPAKQISFEAGIKFGFVMVAEENLVFGIIDQNNSYSNYTNNSDEKVVYDFFDNNSLVSNHGFDRNEWPFNWNTVGILGFSIETKYLNFSIRYNLGLSKFFREISTKDDDFFDNYNTDFDNQVYDSFDLTNSTINNNFRLRSLNLTIGWYFSN